jgi:hypothetical protein
MRSSSAALRRAIVAVELVDAHGRRADERRDVDRDAFALEMLEILAEARPLDREAEIALQFEHLLLHLLVERPHRLALAEDLERDALSHVRQPARVDEQRLGRPRQHVDEARRDRESARIDLVARAPRRQVADRRDLVAADADVAGERRLARAVVDRSAADHDVVR